MSRAIPGSRGRRGQTIILALAILFLLFIVGGIFVVMILRNLQRVTRQSETDSTLTQALAGLQFASNQFRTSPLGADWRPHTAEQLWRNPADLTLVAQRSLDPDNEWLDPTQAQDGIPYVRFANGLGRFLLRVTYLPSFKTASGASTFPDEFDPNSAFIHVECIGRSGDFDPNDPTFLRDPTANKNSPTQGPFRKVEAYVPIGLVDQLWWVTNFTNERSAAQLGVPGFKDGNNRPVGYPAIYRGGIRSNTDLQINGRVVVRVYPARGEGVHVRGSLRYGDGGFDPNSPNPPTGEVQALSDAGGPAAIDTQNDLPGDDARIVLAPPALSGIRPSGPSFDPVPYPTPGGGVRHLVLDEAYARNGTGVQGQSIRFFDPPRLDTADPSSGQNRWYALTRDSGGIVRVPDGATQRTANLGAYGLTDLTLPPDIRAKGLYIPNFDDVQNARQIRNVWLRRGRTQANNLGWLGEYYVPVADETGRPLTDIYFTRVKQDPTDNTSPDIPKILVTYGGGRDRRQQNFGTGGNADLPLQFHQYDPAGNTMQPVGLSRLLDYPENGIIYCEGSVRVRGVVGAPTGSRQVTLVSGGTIYIEGNVLKNDPASFIALLAKDHVALNPTAFTRVRPGASVVVEADTFSPSGTPLGYHFTIPQGGDLDFSLSDASNLANGLLLLKHTAPHESTGSETSVTLNHPANRIGWPDWSQDRVNFGGAMQTGAIPAASIPWIGNAQNSFFYLFHPLSPPSPVNPNFWWESNFQTVNGSPANFERKAFFLDKIATTSADTLPSGLDAWFRFVVGPRDGPDLDGDTVPDPEMSPNGQPYWLSRVALLPDYQDDPMVAPNQVARRGRPLAIQIDAVIYAATGSWFVIPPPYFNENDEDTRLSFAATGVRTTGTLPNNTSQYPFFNEPLNIEITINGAVSENMPAESSDVQKWTNQTWWSNPDPAHNPSADFQEQDLRPFRPNIKYNYDPRLRRMIRVRYTRPYTIMGNLRTEEVVYAGPVGGGLPGPPGTMRTLATARAEALGNNSYIETLPVLPSLPTSSLVYEGNPL